MNTRALMKRVMLPLCFCGTQQATGTTTLSLPLFYTIRWMSLPLLLPPPSKGSTNLGTSSEGSCALLCLCAAPSSFPPPRLPLAGCGQQLWGGQPPTVPGVCFPWGRPASFHTSLKLFPNFQAVWEALQPKYQRCCNRAFCYIAKATLLLPLSNLLLAPTPVMGLHGSLPLGRS